MANMNAKENLLNKVKITIVSKCTVSNPWRDLGYVNKYRMKLWYNERSITYIFYDSVYNFKNNVKPDKLGSLYCILGDRNAYRYSSSLKDFCDNFGYDQYAPMDYARSIYKACGKIAEKLEALFTDEELDQLEEELYEAGY
ncbi:MAG: hypothetical protein NC218_08540 [Acetobacter sp.]|nr:hypothetical protein [Acetobacter sp.]